MELRFETVRKRTMDEFSFGFHHPTSAYQRDEIQVIREMQRVIFQKIQRGGLHVVRSATTAMLADILLRQTDDFLLEQISLRAPQKPCWFDFTAPLELKELNFTLMKPSVLLSAFSDDILREALPRLPQRLHLGARMTIAAHQHWTLTVFGDTNPVLILEFHWERGWTLNGNHHHCPAMRQTCGKSGFCELCTHLCQAISSLVGALLLAETGYFQQVRFVQESITLKRKHLERHKGGKKKEVTTSVTVPYKVIDISAVTIPRRTEEEAEAEKHQGQEPPRISWYELHPAEKIETVTKPAREHYRMLPDGRRIHVNQSKPRQYRRLKDREQGTIIVLDAQTYRPGEH